SSDIEMVVGLISIAAGSSYEAAARAADSSDRGGMLGGGAGGSGETIGGTGADTGVGVGIDGGASGRSKKWRRFGGAGGASDVSPDESPFPPRESTSTSGFAGGSCNRLQLGHKFACVSISAPHEKHSPNSRLIPLASAARFQSWCVVGP